MERWVQIAEAATLSPGQGRTVAAGERQLALFNDGGEFFAIDDSCLHQGGSLGLGTLHAGRVICPLHSWVFELRSGRCPRQTHAPVAVYPTRCHDGVVEVLLPDAPAAGS